MNLKRANEIINLISDREYHNITELAKSLKMPRTTAVRIIAALKEDRKIEVSWGNVKLLDLVEEVKTQDKYSVNFSAKELIAKKAANFIKDGDIIYIDSGSTTAHLVNYIKDKDIVIYTNNLFLFSNISIENFKPIVNVVPGRLYHKTSTIVGTLAIDFLQDIKIDKAFIGVNGVIKKELWTTNQEEAILKSRMLKHASTSYVLFEKHKLNKENKYRFGALNEFVMAVTE